MSRLSSNGNVKVGWILDADLTDPEAPAAAELNGDALDLSAAIAWDGYEVGATDSDDWDDRALTDLGNAITRGFANYAATLPFFYDADFSDTSSVYNDAFDAFRTPLTTGWIVTRVGVPASTAWAANDVVSVFKFIAGTTQTDQGDQSTKFVVEFMQQGQLYVNTRVAIASPVVATPSSDTLTIGEHLAIGATLDSEDITHSATYSSSDTTKATVSDLGIVTAVGSGPATITVDHPSANASDTVTITVS